MARIPIDDDNERAHADADEAAAQAPDDAADFDLSSDEATSAARAPAGGISADALRAERDTLYDRLARVTADFKNTQRRLEAEADQRLQYANQSLIRTLLPVIDNFERALAVAPEKTDVVTLLKGMQIVHDQMIAVLKQQKVEEIAPQPGDAFDPTRHEALMQQDAPQYAGRGPTVVQLLGKGYSLHDRVVRPAQVAVART